MGATLAVFASLCFQVHRVDMACVLVTRPPKADAYFNYNEDIGG